MILKSEKEGSALSTILFFVQIVYLSANDKIPEVTVLLLGEYTYSRNKLVFHGCISDTRKAKLYIAKPAVILHKKSHCVHTGYKSMQK